MWSSRFAEPCGFWGLLTIRWAACKLVSALEIEIDVTENN